MIRIQFEPESLPAEQKTAFENWCKLAETAKSKQTSSDVDFQSKVWRFLKHWLLENVFHGKCAYCEIKIEAGFLGDAEHYRPKGAVTEFDGGKQLPVQRNGQPHGGYYWLAYDWMNLVPSCQRCNAVEGKRTQFPIQGTRVFDETEGPDSKTLNEIEQPYLLHPYDSKHDPRDHLVFSPDGKVVGLDEIGKQSIKVLDLNRSTLVEYRLTWLSALRGDFGRKVGNAIADDAIPDINAKIAQLLADYTKPDRIFSAATRDVLSAVMAQMPTR
jgi:hypothetical protein